MPLSKSEYILWRDCPHTAWLKKRRRASYDACAGAGLSDFERALVETGNQVEGQARRLYPSGKLIEGRGDDAVELTAALLAQRQPVIFQAAFSDGTLFAAIDILLVNPATGALSVLEVKATTEDKTPKKKPDKFLADSHVQDLGFQVSLLQRLGHTVERAAIMHLNKDYERRGELDLRALFVEDDITAFLNEWMPAIDADIEKAVAFISGDCEPMGPCGCIYRGRSNHCTAFAHFNPAIGPSSVHDITYIGTTLPLLRKLVDTGIVSISGIPPDFGFTQNRQLRQIEAHQSGQAFVDRAAIEAELGRITYPIHFLDYETFAPAIPRFDGYRPFQHMPFQFSLHIVRSPGAAPEHHAFLYTDGDDPATELFAHLRPLVSETGSIVVWSKAMKGSNVHDRQKLRLPHYSEFFAGMNARIVDLLEIFQKQYYVMPAFYGRTSIKYVLPALVGWSYADLGIGNGTEAMNTWNQIVLGEITGDLKAVKCREMLEYCELDTKAMWAIWARLRDEVVQPLVHPAAAAVN